MALYLGIDFGTSTAKATVLDDNLRIICKVKERLHLLNPQPGFYEVDPENTWWRTFIKMLNSIAKICQLEEIKAVCISSVCGSFVPVDEFLKPTYNAILYGIDTRAAEIVNRLNKLFDYEYLISTLGSRFTTHSVIPKFLWLKEKMPNVYKKTTYFVESTNYITSKLTGVVTWDLPTASGCQLVDLVNLDYPTKIIETVGLDSNKLPKLGWPTQVLGTVSKTAARLTGLKEGTKVMIGTCDIYAEAVGCGVVNPGDLLLVLGSTTSIFLHTDSLVFVEGFSTGVSLWPGLYKLGGATSSGARFVEALQKLLRPLRGKIVSTHTNLPTGLIILPYLDGARCPYHNPSAVGVIYGLKSDTKLEDFHVALLESLAIEIAVAITRLANCAPYNSPVHVTGGLSNIEFVTHLLANVLDDVIVVHHGIDASVGDAVIAAIFSSTIERPFIGVNHFTTTVLPEKDIANKYRPLIKKYDLIYNHLLPIMST
ncbi:MAG: FGGY family carbohydrate kinase [Nitrososphaeria archaeon]